jgi:hypothetical protein
MISDGGIRNPRVPAPAREPWAMDRSYPSFSSSARVMRPTVAVVAALEPETAANSVQEMMFISNRPPGSR